MYIIPKVNHLKTTNTTVCLPEKLTMSYFNKYCDKAVLLKNRLFSVNKDLQFTDESSAFIKLEYNENLSREAFYSIKVDDNGICVKANSAESAGYACTTLYHIINSASDNCDKLNHMYIEDWPKYAYRGVHLDTARHYFETCEITKIIEQLALLKFNVLHWHFADDQAWRLQINAFPLLTESCKGKCYTQEQARSIVSYAEERGINIIPEIEIPGHSTAAIAAYPWLSCEEKQVKAPSTGGIFDKILCAGKPLVYDFVEKVIDEICSIFPSPFVHIGGDEAPKKEWKKCANCTKKLNELGLSNMEQLQGHMLNFAADVLRKHDKYAICWNDCLKADNLKENIDVQYWKPCIISKGEKQKQRKIIFSDVMSLYFDYPHSFSNLKKICRFKPYVNGKAFTDLNRIKGIECAVWTERIATNAKLEYMLFPRCAAVAEISWQEKADYKSFIERLNVYYKIFKMADINAAPIHDANISGVRRICENIKFFCMMTKCLYEIKKEKHK